MKKMLVFNHMNLARGGEVHTLMHICTHTHTHTCWWHRYAGRRNECVLAIWRSDDGHRSGEVGWGWWGRGKHPWGEKLRQFCRALHSRRCLAWLLWSIHTHRPPASVTVTALLWIVQWHTHTLIKCQKKKRGKKHTQKKHSNVKPQTGEKSLNLFLPCFPYLPIHPSMCTTLSLPAPNLSCVSVSIWH